MTTRPSMGRRLAKNSYEADAFSPYWRRRVAAFQRAGLAHSWKKIAARRERHAARQNIKPELIVPNIDLEVS